MTESRDCLTSATKYNVEPYELQTGHRPETQSMCLVCVSVALACGWVAVRCTGSCPSRCEVCGWGTCECLQGSLGVGWLWRRGALEEGVWRRPDTELTFEQQQPGLDQAAIVPERSRKHGVVLRLLWTAPKQRAVCVFADRW